MNTTFGCRSIQRCSASRERRPVAGLRLERRQPRVDEVVADVPASPGPDGHSSPPTRGELDRHVGDLDLRVRLVRLAIRSTTCRYASRVANVIVAYTPAGSSRSVRSSALCRSTNDFQSRRPIARRLVMLFAVITCVSARRSFARAAASSALTPSSPIHGSSQASGAECSEMRICRRKRDDEAGREAADAT